MRTRPIFTPGVRPPRRAFYFYLLDDCARISAFYVANHDDTPTDEFPDGQYVETVSKEGVRTKWEKRSEGDLLVFRPPDPELGRGCVGWAYDRRVQVGECAPRELLERYAIQRRVTTNGDRRL